MIDVFAGQLVPNMIKVVAVLRVPYIAIHIGGNTTTMQNIENL